MARCADNVHTFGGIKIAVEVGKDEKFAAARADFLHIGFDFVQQAVVGCDDDDGHVFVHQGKRPVLQFASRIGFGVDVGDFLQF